jgi:hypothetical protein
MYELSLDGKGVDGILDMRQGGRVPPSLERGHSL